MAAAAVAATVAFGGPAAAQYTHDPFISDTVLLSQAMGLEMTERRLVLAATIPPPENYQLTEQTAILGGFHQGVHRFEDNNDEFNFQGGLTWKGPNDRLSLAYGLDWGRNDAAGLREEYIHSLVMKYQLTENLLYVLQNDLGQVNNPDAQWYGINQYFLYTINPKWSIGTRVEWFRDEDGTRVMGIGNLPGAYGWLGAAGYAGDFTEVTLGLNYKPHANVTLRPEVRWDWYNGPPNAAGPYPLPFDDGASSRQFTLAVDLTVTF